MHSVELRSIVRQRFGFVRGARTLLRRLAILGGVLWSGVAFACPPAPAPFVPFDGEPFRFRADLVDVGTCSVAWFTLGEGSFDIDSSIAGSFDFDSVIARIFGIDVSIDDWLMLHHPSSFPLFLDPEQVAGPTAFDSVFGNRVTLDARTFVVALGIRFDRVYNEGIFMRLVFELPARPSAVVPIPPPAPPEPTLVEVQRERWGAFEVVGESEYDTHYNRPNTWLDRVRIIDADGEVRWEPEYVYWMAFDVGDVFGDGTPVLSVTGHTGGNPCCDVAYAFVQREGELVMIAAGFETWLRDYDDDGVPERRTSAFLRVPAPVNSLWVPVLQVWDSATTSFGPVVTRERFAPTLAKSLETYRERLLEALVRGRDVVHAAAQVYAIVYYQDPTAAAAERERLRSELPTLEYAELVAIFAAVETAVDAFAAEAATWQPHDLGGD